MLKVARRPTRSKQTEILIVGPKQSGKTSLTQLLLTSQYTGKILNAASNTSSSSSTSTPLAASSSPLGVTLDTDPPATLGVDMYTQEHSLNGEKQTLCYWDCSGQERVRPFVQMLLGRAKVVILVYDSRYSTSLRDLDFWRSECERLCPDAVLFVAGTHADVDTSSRVKVEDASAQAREWKAHHVLTSSKTSLGGSTLLTALVDACAEMKNG